MNKAQTTATPWNYIVSKSLIHIETPATSNPAGVHVASIPKNREADAALIVRAVNEYDALNDVAKAAQNLLDNPPNEGAETSRKWILENALAALAEVRNQS